MSEDLSTSSFSGNTNDGMVCFKALQGLTHLLPPTASDQGRGWSCCSVKLAISFLVDFAPSGTSISSLFDTPDSSVRTQQPYILCLGHPSGATHQYVIVAKTDKISIPLGDEGLTCSLDKLFKMYWVCNLAYPVQLLSVFSSLEHIYEMPVSGKKRSKVVELISKLNAMS
ncbi:hypothetical protein ATANTOWER_019765 [Ataeniobius toweri]|uniref:Uncharacterized protein n=1 Tax=Ataeniobius toweri TaxID=208326 RepID=A0ABU7ASJ9_9TELE|nr:hypothetical protein [Ataeniobius toweri]